MIVYTDTVAGIAPDALHGGFFLSWPNPPSAETHLRVVRASDHVILAVDDTNGTVVGFVTAISDGVLSAYIPLLEVRSAYRGQGIGTELMRRMLAKLRSLYMVDLTCDPAVQRFYARLGMRPSTGMMMRNHDRQSGT